MIEAPVNQVWRVFTDPARRPEWRRDVDSVELVSQTPDQVQWRESRWGLTEAVTEELRLTVLEPGQRCVVELADRGDGRQREYVFTQVQVGRQRGGTVVTVADRASGLADRLLDLVVGGFAARTVEGAVRDELNALAAGCVTRVFAPAA